MTVKQYLTLVLAAVLCFQEMRAQNATPAWDWSASDPASQGMSSAALEALQKNMAAHKTRALLVIRNDKIVCEWYAPSNSISTRQGTASLAKALVGGMSLAVAMTDGRISLDDPAMKFIPQWRDDPKKSRITVRELGSHTSGLDDAETDDVRHELLTGWKGDFWKRLNPPNDPFTIARDKTPMVYEPGTQLQYSNPGLGLLAYCTTAAIQGGAIDDVRTLLRDRILRPIGVRDDQWTCGYGTNFNVDGLSLVASWGGAAFTPRATARIGRLVLREGNWEGKRILSKKAILEVTTDSGMPGNCGMGWWGNGGARYPKLPKDAVWGAGAGDQLLLVIPSLKLIMVRNGAALEPGPGEPPLRKDDVFTRYHDYRAAILFEPLVAAITNVPTKSGRAPYPPSPVIKEVRWAPKETIPHRALGSDNWPTTWGDDDLLYTAYGDGNGFEPFVPEKLSMGLAMIAGTPPDFTGVNLRSPGAEYKGGGAAGRKASGILMVGGVLYLWTRNVANSQLGWSTDHGKTWTWADWKFTNSFACPTFLQFGKNYAGARDEFVYLYSPDRDSAYEAADGMVLARVSQDHIRERAAYEFFQRLNASGEPMWTHDLAERGAVFIHPEKCGRSGISYNAGLRRYLWSQVIPAAKGKKTDGRFEGGFGIYDAPNPWGPWTTVFYSENWDVPPGETSSFPTKWMSADGRTLHLVFSAGDSFSLRKAELVP